MPVKRKKKVSPSMYEMLLNIGGALVVLRTSTPPKLQQKTDDDGVGFLVYSCEVESVTSRNEDAETVLGVNTFFIPGEYVAINKDYVMALRQLAQTKKNLRK